MYHCSVAQYKLRTCENTAVPPTALEQKMTTPRWLLACFLLSVGLAACTPPADPVVVTRPVIVTEMAETAVPPTSTATPSPAQTIIPSNPPVVLLPSLSPTPSATPTATFTPTPQPTSDVVAGWQTYTSSYYAYTVSFPPEARLRRQGVDGFPTEELPEGMTSEAYLDQLKETYPNDICVSIGFGLGSVHILAPLEEGGKYHYICPGLGIGDYDIVDISETLMIDGRSITTTFGSQILERDEAGTFRSEFLRFELEDGTTITYYAGPDESSKFEEDYAAAYEAFLADRATLLQIIASYRAID
jgi:hypothetical protein